MRHSILCLLLGGVCLILSSSLSAQSFFDAKSSLQLNLGASKTFHTKAPANLWGCIEPCLIFLQEARVAPKVHISYFRQLNQSHSLLFSIGYSENRFWEFGSSFAGSRNANSYTGIHSIGFLNLELGHRLFLNSTNRLRPFWENSVICQTENPRFHDYTIKPFNFSLNTKVGIVYELGKFWAVNVSGTYQFAAFRYNRVELSTFPNIPVNYFPYSHGLELGISRAI